MEINAILLLLLLLLTESAQNPTESILEVLKDHYFKKQYVNLQMEPTNKKQILNLLQLDKQNSFYTFYIRINMRNEFKIQLSRQD